MIMEPLTIFLHWNSFGMEHDCYWPFPLLIFFVIIMMCFLFRRRRRRPYSRWWPGWSVCGYYEKSEAEAILKKRYAKGEISKEEYEKMKEDISKCNY